MLFRSFVLQCERQPDLRANAVAVGTHVADDANRLAGLYGVEYAVNDFGMGLHKKCVNEAAASGLRLGRGGVFQFLDNF